MKNRILLKKSQALSYFGSESSIAVLLKIKRQAVNQWGEYIPEQSAWPLYYLSNGKINAVIDIYPPEEQPRIVNE
jgi:hypothetical protein